MPLPTGLLMKTESPANKKEFYEFAEWLQSIQHNGHFPLHVLMRVLVDEAYSPSKPSLFDEDVAFEILDFETESVQENGVYGLSYTAKVKAALPIEGEQKDVVFYLSDREFGLSLEAAENLETIILSGLVMATNGRRTSVDVLMDYQNLTTYLHTDTE